MASSFTMNSAATQMIMSQLPKFSGHIGENANKFLEEWQRGMAAALVSPIQIYLLFPFYAKDEAKLWYELNISGKTIPTSDEEASTEWKSLVTEFEKKYNDTTRDDVRKVSIKRRTQGYCESLVDYIKEMVTLGKGLDKKIIFDHCVVGMRADYYKRVSKKKIKTLEGLLDAALVIQKEMENDDKDDKEKFERLFGLPKQVNSITQNTNNNNFNKQSKKKFQQNSSGYFNRFNQQHVNNGNKNNQSFFNNNGNKNNQSFFNNNNRNFNNNVNRGYNNNNNFNNNASNRYNYQPSSNLGNNNGFIPRDNNFNKFGNQNYRQNGYQSNNNINNNNNNSTMQYATPNQNNAPQASLPSQSANQNNRSQIYNQGRSINFIESRPLTVFKILTETGRRASNGFVYVDVIVNGITYNAFIDFGSQLTVIDDSLLDGSESLGPILFDIDSFKADYYATTNKIFSVYGKEKKYEVVVAKNYKELILLSINIFADADLCVHARTGRIFKANDKKSFVHAKEDVEIPPKQIRMIESFVSKDARRFDSLMVHTPDNMYAKNKIAVNNAIINGNPNKIKVINGSNSVRMIKKGQVLVAVEQIDPVNIKGINNETFKSSKYTPVSIEELAPPHEKYTDIGKKEIVKSVEFANHKINVGKDLTEQQVSSLLACLDRNMNVFPSDDKIIGKVKNINYHIPIKEGSKPVKHAPSRSTLEKVKIVEDAIDDLLEQGIVRPSISQWASRTVLVQKKDGKPRICIDYRDVNKTIEDDAYPNPDTNMCVRALAGAKYFTQLDLNSAFHQIPLSEESKQVTAFVSPTGRHLEYQSTPFGLKISMQAFMRVLDMILAGLKFVEFISFVDDLIIFADNYDEHIARLDKILGLLGDNGCTVKLSKCNFAVNSVMFLGFEVDGQSIRPAEGMIEKISKLKEPKNVTDVKSIIGTMQYVRKMVPYFSQRTNCITNLTRKGVPFIWGDEQQRAFNELKNIIVNRPVLHHFDSQRLTKLYTDASIDGLGGVLTQMFDDQEFPIGYFSRCTRGAEKNYPIYDLEVAAALESVLYFKDLLENVSFEAIVDNRAASYMMSAKELTGRLARTVLILNNYKFNIKLVKSEQNFFADFLSRHASNARFTKTRLVKDGEDFTSEMEQTVPKTLDTALNQIKEINAVITRNDPFGDLKRAQADCPVISDLITSLERGDQIANFELDKGVAVETSGGVKKPYIPEEMREVIMIAHHDIPIAGHLGQKKTIAKLSDRYYWPSMKDDIIEYVRTCHVCQLRKRAVQPTYGVLQQVKGDYPFHTIAIDHITDAPKSYGCKYIITLIDLYTKFAIAKAVTSNSTAVTAKFIMNDLVFTYGVIPTRILTDRHSGFRSALYEAFTDLLQIKRVNTSGYYPQTNGCVEKFNGTLVQMLSPFVNENQTNWQPLVKAVVYAYNTSMQDTIGMSPFEAFLGRKPKLPTEFGITTSDPDFAPTARQIEYVEKQLQERNETRHLRNKKIYDRTHQPPDFKVGDEVLVKDMTQGPRGMNKFPPKYRGPFDVIRVNNNNTIEVSDDLNPIVNVSKVKHYFRRIGNSETFTGLNVANINSIRVNRPMRKYGLLTNLLMTLMLVGLASAELQPLVWRDTGESPIGEESVKFLNISLVSPCVNLVGMDDSKNISISVCNNVYRDVIINPLYSKCRSNLMLENPVKLWGMMGVGVEKFVGDQKIMSSRGSKLFQSKFKQFGDLKADIDTFDIFIMMIMKTLGVLETKVKQIVANNVISLKDIFLDISKIVCGECELLLVKENMCQMNGNNLLVKVNIRELKPNAKIIESDPFKVGMESDSGCFKKLKIANKFAYDYKTECASNIEQVIINNHTRWISTLQNKCEMIELDIEWNPIRCVKEGVTNYGLDFKRDSEKFVAWCVNKHLESNFPLNQCKSVIVKGINSTLKNGDMIVSKYSDVLKNLIDNRKIILNPKNIKFRTSNFQLLVRVKDWCMTAMFSGEGKIVVLAIVLVVIVYSFKGCRHFIDRIFRYRYSNVATRDTIEMSTALMNVSLNHHRRMRRM